MTGPRHQRRISQAMKQHVHTRQALVDIKFIPQQALNISAPIDTQSVFGARPGLQASLERRNQLRFQVYRSPRPRAIYQAARTFFIVTVNPRADLPLLQ